MNIRIALSRHIHFKDSQWQKVGQRVRRKRTENKKPALSGWFLRILGGGGGIRTLEAFRLTHFPGVLLRPLGHPSEILFDEQVVIFPNRTAHILCVKL